MLFVYRSFVSLVLQYLFSKFNYFRIYHRQGSKILAPNIVSSCNALYYISVILRKTPSRYLFNYNNPWKSVNSISYFILYMICNHNTKKKIWDHFEPRINLTFYVRHVQVNSCLSKSSMVNLFREIKRYMRWFCLYYILSLENKYFWGKWCTNITKTSLENTNFEGEVFQTL